MALTRPALAPPPGGSGSSRGIRSARTIAIPWKRRTPSGRQEQPDDRELGEHAPAGRFRYKAPARGPVGRIRWRRSRTLGSGPATLENRLYQETIAANAVGRNTLVVLPTGLGKTAIALRVIAEHLLRFPERSVLFLAPTRPLVVQHARSVGTTLFGPARSSSRGPSRPRSARRSSILRRSSSRPRR